MMGGGIRSGIVHPQLPCSSFSLYFLFLFFLNLIRWFRSGVRVRDMGEEIRVLLVLLFAT